MTKQKVRIGAFALGAVSLGAISVGLFGCEEKTVPGSSQPSPEPEQTEEVVLQDSPENTTTQVQSSEDDDNYALTRVCTFNVEDLRYDDIMAGLRGDENPGANRARDVARLIAAIDPDILFVNELEFDFISSEPMSGRAFADLVSQQREYLGLGHRHFAVYQAPPNTGIHSGFDLDRDGQVVAEPLTRGYGNDALGYGDFPGHYAMALLVAEPLAIVEDEVRTFRDFRWATMPEALLPPGDGERVPQNEPWYTPSMLEVLPLSSKSHWDVPVDLGDGEILHIYASHPTPPVFDGPEDRNGRRNHDEIRFWGEYLSGAEWIVDDAGEFGAGVPAPAVVMGDLNSDPLMGDSRDNPVAVWLMDNPRIDGAFTPVSTVELEIEDRLLRPMATAEFGLRVDYVLPTREVDVIRGGIVRGEADLPMSPAFSHEILDSIRYEVSDHFPVWIDVRLRDFKQ